MSILSYTLEKKNYIEKDTHAAYTVMQRGVRAIYLGLVSCSLTYRT